MSPGGKFFVLDTTPIRELSLSQLRYPEQAAWLEEAAPGRPNAVARLRGGDGPTLVLCAHLDTVSSRLLGTLFLVAGLPMALAMPPLGSSNTSAN